MAGSPPKEEEPTKVAHRTRNAERRDSTTQAEKDALAKKKAEKERQKAIREGLKSDYVEPTKRQLGYLQELVHSPHDKSKCIEPMDFQLRKIVGFIVSIQKPGVSFTEEFIDDIANLASEYMHRLISQLHKYTEVQRHRKPGIYDLQLCFLQQRINPGSLYLEYERSKDLTESQRKHKKALESQTNNLVQEFYAEEFHLDKNDPSLVFHASDQYEVASLIPRQKSRPSYIPDYFPTLPPDYTYQSTGSYMKTITELKQIKLKLVEESRLNERSLYKLLEHEEKQWVADNVSDIETDNDDIMSASGEDPVTDIESPHEVGQATGEKELLHEHKKDEGEKRKLEEVEKTNVEETAKEVVEVDADSATKSSDSAAKESLASGKRFDFIEYANKRKAAKERASKKLAAHRKKREDDILMKREKLYSPYAKSLPTAQDDAYFESILKKSFRRVIKYTREAHERKKAKIAELLEERAKHEKENEINSGSFEFGFAFNPDADILDESEEENEVKEFDFGDEDDFKLIENRTDVAGKRPSSGYQTAQATEDSTKFGHDNNGDVDMVDAANADDDDGVGEDDVGDLENELDNALNENETTTIPSLGEYGNGMAGFEDSDSESVENDGHQFGDDKEILLALTTEPQTTTFEMNFPQEMSSDESEEDEMVDT